MFCLVRLPAVESFRFSTASVSVPLGLAYIAAALEESGREVTVVDAVGADPKRRTRSYKGFLIGMTLQEVAAAVPSNSKIIGISVIFTHEWPLAVKLIELIKSRLPDVPIMLGGEHVTSMPDFCLLTSQADMIVLGEGEETVVEAADAIEQGTPYDEIPGIAYRSEDSVIVNPRRPRRKDIDSIPLPAWHHFDIESYTKHRLVWGMETGEVTIPILATRGCPYQCTYCSSPNMWTPRWYARTPSLVLDEIELYMERYGARNFPFQDLTAIVKRDWIIEFCEDLLRRELNITWQLPSGTRCEAIDDEVASLLNRSGMVNTAYAPETGSEQTRVHIKKQLKTERLMDSIRSAAKNDLNIGCFLVIGFPDDDLDTLAANLPFVKLLADAGVTDVAVNFYMALPGTELFRRLEQEGRIKLDRRYFCHILDALAPVPSTSYNDRLSRFTLFYWKFNIFFHFYSAKSKGGLIGGLARSVFHGISGLIVKRHTTKLQTAVGYALKNLRDEILVRFKKRWIPKDEETELFRSWESMFEYVSAHRLKTQEALPPSDKANHPVPTSIVPLLRREHSTKKIIPLRPASEPAREAVHKS